MKKQLDVVREIAAEKLHVDLKSLLHGCLPQILVHILPLSAAAATADKQAKLTAVGFECYNMLIAELGKQVLTAVVLRQVDSYVVGVLFCFVRESFTLSGDCCSNIT